jgi:hypothetical protein
MATLEETQARDACHMASAGALCNKGYFQTLGEYAMSKRGAALLSRSTCVAFGATPKQLLPGTLFIADGDTNFNAGTASWAKSVSPWVTATAAHALGDELWADNKFAGAASYYEICPLHYEAAGHWHMEAGESWMLAFSAYELALNHFDDLAMLLMMW